jgi:hypothetical protein
LDAIPQPAIKISRRLRWTGRTNLVIFVLNGYLSESWKLLGSIMARSIGQLSKLMTALANKKAQKKPNDLPAPFSLSAPFLVTLLVKNEVACVCDAKKDKEQAKDGTWKEIPPGRAERIVGWPRPSRRLSNTH